MACVCVLRHAARGGKEEEEYEEEEEEEVGYARADEDDEEEEDRVALVPHAFEPDRGTHVMQQASAHKDKMGKGILTANLPPHFFRVSNTHTMQGGNSFS